MHIQGRILRLHTDMAMVTHKITKDHTDTGALCELQGHGGQGGQPR